jgi:hypothetical protein
MTFALERFEWAPGELEVAGRWTAETPRRFRRVRLVVEQDGGRLHRLTPMTATPLQATPEGSPWSATFAWEGEEPPVAAMLEAGHDLLVELPAPDRMVVRASAGADDAALAAARADLAEQRAELVEAQRLVEEERERLAAERTELAALRSELAVVAEVAAPAPVAEPAPVAVAERPLVHSPNGNGHRHAAIQQALERPHQPDDPVRGPAPLAIRVIAVALTIGLLIILAMILGAIL